MEKRFLKTILIISLIALALFFNSDLAKAGAPIPVDFKFERNIIFGERSKDVEYLQAVLSHQPDHVYPERLTTGYFGLLTQRAVERFQEEYREEVLAPLRLVAPTGHVGPSTRKRLNEILDTFDAYNPSIPWFKVIEEAPGYEAYKIDALPGYLAEAASFEEIKDYDMAGAERIAVIVNSQLSDKINDSLVQYFQDLNEEGYSVLFTKWQSGKPTVLRSYLQEKYTASAGLVGTVFIGELPVAWYELENDFYDKARFPIDLYYMDMTGTWVDTNNDGKFNERSGNNRPDIWLGRLTAHILTGNETSLLRDYFIRNHDYRTGKLERFPQALSYVDDDWNHRTTNSLDWTYDEVVVVNDSYGTNASDYKNNRLPGDYDFIHVMVHSSPAAHRFYGAVGGLVWNTDVKDINQKPYFYNLFACSNARYTSTDYMGGWYTFSGNGLAAVGSTKIGAMTSFQDFYGPLGEGKTLGEAYKEWWQRRNPAHLSVQRWHFGMTLLGDPTLKIQPEKEKDTHSLSVNSPFVTGISITSATGHSGTTNYTKTGITSGTAVSLTAPATYGDYFFSSWTGCDSVSSRTCSLAMNSNRSVVANYKLILSVSKSGTGSGTVVSNPAGINCGSTCLATYDPNTSVTLTATPSSGSTFKGWSGDCAGTGICTVTMDSKKFVTATFDLSAITQDCTTYNNYLYCRGFKSTDPQGSSCNAACSERGYTCPVGDSMFRSLSDIVNVATTLGLLAPGESYRSYAGSYSTSYIRNAISTGAKQIYYNSGWNQSCTYAPGTDSSYERVNICRCQGEVITHNLVINSSPIAGISITSATGHSGTTNYTKTGITSGTAVSLTAPATYSNYQFTGWSGTGCSSSNNTVSFSITSNITCTANYKESIPIYTLSVTKSGTGSGTVTSNPTGINCGNTCSASYNQDTSVTLTATPSSDSVFSGWSGTCTGTGTCTVTMDSKKFVTATFDLSVITQDCTTYNNYLYCRGFKSTDPQGSSCNAACSARGYTCPVGDSMFRSLSDIVNVATTLGLLAPGESYSSYAGSYSTSYIRNAISTGAKHIYYNSGWNQSCTYAPGTDSYSERFNICRCQEVSPSQSLKDAEHQLASLSNIISQLIDSLTNLIRR